MEVHFHLILNSSLPQSITSPSQGSPPHSYVPSFTDLTSTPQNLQTRIPRQPLSAVLGQHRPFPLSLIAWLQSLQQPTLCPPLYTVHRQCPYHHPPPLTLVAWSNAPPTTMPAHLPSPPFRSTLHLVLAPPTTMPASLSSSHPPLPPPPASSLTLVAWSNAVANGTSGSPGARQPGSTPNPMRQMLSNV